MADLLALPPVLPDFLFCDPFYNSGEYAQLSLADCIAAEAQMPRGSVPTVWQPSSVDEENVHVFEIPKVYLAGFCEIKVELVHPMPPAEDTTFEIAPDTFRGMAGWVIRNCVEGFSPLGGFITKNISNVVDYLLREDVDLNPEAYPFRTNPSPMAPASNASFFTVSVTGFTMQDEFVPGHHDPTVAGAIYDALYTRLVNLGFRDARWNQLFQAAERIALAWSLMGRTHGDGGGYPWYGEAGKKPPEQTTTYECDSALGNPRHLDCSQLQYSQLQTPAGSLSLEAGETTFLHAGTCSVGISTSVSTVLLWDQIKRALNDLVEICVNNPLVIGVGGRAFYGKPTQKLYNIGGQKVNKREEPSDALPPHANITLFRQYEIYPTFPEAAEEIQSCTWQKVLHGQDVRPCQSFHHRQSRPPNAGSPQSGNPCVINSDCGSDGKSICALNDGIALDVSGLSNFSCTSISDATTALGSHVSEVPQCEGRCLTSSNSTNRSLTAVPLTQNPALAPLPPDVICPCNCTYVAHDCCLSESKIVQAEPWQKLNITVQAPNSTVCCNADTGKWDMAPVQRDNLTLNTPCPHLTTTDAGTGYINS